MNLDGIKANRQNQNNGNDEILSFNDGSNNILSYVDKVDGLLSYNDRDDVFLAYDDEDGNEIRDEVNDIAERHHGSTSSSHVTPSSFYKRFDDDVNRNVIADRGDQRHDTEKNRYDLPYNHFPPHSEKLYHSNAYDGYQSEELFGSDHSYQSEQNDSRFDDHPDRYDNRNNYLKIGKLCNYVNCY